MYDRHQHSPSSASASNFECLVTRLSLSVDGGLESTRVSLSDVIQLLADGQLSFYTERGDNPIVASTSSISIVSCE